MSNARNVESLARLVGFCTGLGGQYNPGNQNLQLANMQTLLSNARELLDKVSTAKTAFENVTDHRELVYDDLRDIVGRIIAELKSSGATSQSIANAQTMARKIKGIRHKAEPESEALPDSGEVKPAKRRARGLDYVNVAHHFGKLLETLAVEPNYEPNVPALQVTELIAKLDAMRQANDEVIKATVALRNVRIERDVLLYAGNSSLIVTGRKAKNKIKALFGYGGKDYESVREIRFTKPND